MHDTRRDDPISMLLSYHDVMAIMQQLIKALHNEDLDSDESLFQVIWDHFKQAISDISGGGFLRLKTDRLIYKNMEDYEELLVNEYRKPFEALLTKVRNEQGFILWHASDFNNEYKWIKKIFDCQEKPVHLALFRFEENPWIFIIFRIGNEHPFYAHEKQIMEVLHGIVSFSTYKSYKYLSQTYLQHISAHTFEKLYNTQIRNICYFLRRFIHPYNDRARMFTFAIQDFIDLWSNQFSANTYEKLDKNETEWIEKFRLYEFKADMENFATHIFNLRVNDLYDHYLGENKERLPQEVGSFDDIINGDKSRQDFFELDIDFGDDFGDGQIWIFGVRPFFRVILFDMLYNAIEALDLFKIVEYTGKGKPKSVIKMNVIQDDNETTIQIINDGRKFDDDKSDDGMIQKLNRLFEKAEEGNLHFHTREWRTAMKNKIYTTKTATGNGMALAQAAYYLSRIVYQKNNKIQQRGSIHVECKENRPFYRTTFTITLPFGYRMTGKDPCEFQTEKEKICFQWNGPR